MTFTQAYQAGGWPPVDLQKRYPRNAGYFQLNLAINDMQKPEIVTRIVLCSAAAILNALYVGFQGNGNLIPSGLLIGFILGSAWALLLLFGIPLLGQKFRLPMKRGLSWVSLAIFCVLIAFICFRLWG